MDMAHGLGWISNLYYLTDSDLGLDSVLPSGWVGYFSDSDLVLDSVLPSGWVGLRIMDLKYFSYLDLDSVLLSGWVGLWI